MPQVVANQPTSMPRKQELQDCHQKPFYFNQLLKSIFRRPAIFSRSSGVSDEEKGERASLRHNLTTPSRVGAQSTVEHNNRGKQHPTQAVAQSQGAKGLQQGGQAVQNECAKPTSQDCQHQQGPAKKYDSPSVPGECFCACRPCLCPDPCRCLDANQPFYVPPQDGQSAAAFSGCKAMPFAIPYNGVGYIPMMVAPPCYCPFATPSSSACLGSSFPITKQSIKYDRYCPLFSGINYEGEDGCGRSRPLSWGSRDHKHACNDCSKVDDCDVDGDTNVITWILVAVLVLLVIGLLFNIASTNAASSSNGAAISSGLVSDVVGGVSALVGVLQHAVLGV